MKGNDGSGNNKARDLWETPQWLFEILHEQYNFKFDCCANKNNRKVLKYSNDFIEENTIKHGGWMNPPFSKSKEMFIHFFKLVWEGVAIYRCDNMETEIWQKTIFPNADWVFIFKSRICYEGMKGKGARFPSALIGKGVKPPEGIQGVCLRKL